MCGKYYLKNETLKQLSSYVDEMEDIDVDGDLCPGKYIPVLIHDQQRLLLTSMKWGYTLKNQSQVVINARCESLFEKKMFKEDILYHRCLIPVNGFYERDQHHREFTFEKSHHHFFYLAGIYREREKEVVIITTKANHVMSPIHSRMPLIIDNQDMRKWLFSSRYIESLLQRNDEDLEIVSGLFQQSLFDM